MKAKYSFSDRSLREIETVHQDLQYIFKNLLFSSPYDFGITHGLRTAEKQAELYAIGRTTHINKPFVTYLDGVKKKSKHQFGRAVDICVYDENNKITWDDPFYFQKVADEVKRIAKKRGVNLIWGGDWKNFKDYPHFELA